MNRAAYNFRLTPCMDSTRSQVSTFLVRSTGNEPSHTTPTPGLAGSPLLIQSGQQEDCNVSNATAANPSGCLHDLFPYTETTVGAGANGIPQPPNFCTDYAPG